MHQLAILGYNICRKLTENYHKLYDAQYTNLALQNVIHALSILLFNHEGACPIPIAITLSLTINRDPNPTP